MTRAIDFLQLVVAWMEARRRKQKLEVRKGYSESIQRAREGLEVRVTPELVAAE